MLLRFKKFIKRNTVILVFLSLVFIGFAYYFFIHRHPRTDNAFVVANVRPVSALVAGHITNIYVVNNQEVKKGDKLFTVYTEPYELAVKQLQAELEAAKYSSKSFQEQIKRNKLLIEQNNSKLQDAEYLALQAQKLYSEDAAVSQQEAVVKTNTMAESKAGLDIAKSDYIIAVESYNQSLASIQGLEAQLQEAQVNLNMTTLYAQSNGLISNMFISTGTYANVGQPLFSFIDTDSWWVQANLEETELSHVRPGQQADVRLWMYPGHTFKGIVDKIGWNVNRQISSSNNAMSVVQNEDEWFLLPQRFPVQIKLMDADLDKYPMHVGASATVIIKTPASEFRGWLWYLGLW